MKETRWEANPKQPYGLHDCRICAMQLSGGDLHLAFEDGFYKEDGSFVQGSISVEGVDLDFCEVLLQGSAGRMGGFRGERLAIAEFVKQYEGFRFEVIDEFYGWHRLQYAGWLWMPGKRPKEMALHLGYFAGDLIFRTQEG